MKDPVLILGAGYVGTKLAEVLGTSGRRVFAVRRSFREPDEAMPNVSWLRADLLDSKSLGALPPSPHVVYSAAASGSTESDYRDIYLNGLSTVIKCLKDSPLELKSFLFTSSTSVYGQREGELVDERSETSPDNFRGQIMLEAESLAQEAFYCSSVVRFGGIYGPGRTRLVQMIKSGTGLVEASNDYYTNRIHLDDCARILEHLLDLSERKPLYLAVDCAPAPISEVCEFLAGELKIDYQSLAPFPVTRRMWNKRCSNQLLLNSGYQFSYPSFREGYHELI